MDSNPFCVVPQQWNPGDTREIETRKVDRREGLEYDSYERVYLADGRKWRIVGQIAREDGRKYYILECVG